MTSLNSHLRAGWRAGQRGCADDRGARSGSLGAAFLALAFSASYLWFRGQDIGNWDNQSYAFIACDFLRTWKLYESVWLDKPPLAFAAYLPACAGDPILSMNVYFCAIVSLEALLLRALLHRLGSDSSAALVGVVALLLSILWIPDVAWLSLAHVGNVILLFGLLLACRQTTASWGAAGAVIASGFFVRQNAIVLGLVPLLLLSWNASKAATYLVCGAISLLVLLALFVPFSNVELLFDTTFAYPFRYRSVEHVAADLPSTTVIAGRFLYYLCLPLFVSCIALLVGWAAGRQSPVAAWRMVACFGAVLATCLLPAKPWLHYLGYMAVWIGIAAAWSAARLLPRLPVPIWAGVATGAAALIVATNYEMEAKPAATDAFRKIDHMVADATAARAEPATIQVFCNADCGPAGLLLRGRVPANPLFHPIYYTNDFMRVLPQALSRPWNMLAANPPDILVYSSAEMRAFFGVDLRPRIGEILALERDYEKAGQVGEAAVWTRRRN